MYCEKCGTQIEESAMFCTECENKIRKNEIKKSSIKKDNTLFSIWYILKENGKCKEIISYRELTEN